MKEKVLCWRDGDRGFLGTIGDSTSHPDYHVGDVIVYKNPYSNEGMVTSVISKDKDGKDYPMGLKGTSILELSKKTEVILVVNHTNLTDDILHDIRSAVKLKEIEVIEMNKTQIEEELGYRIKIVN